MQDNGQGDRRDHIEAMWVGARELVSSGRELQFYCRCDGNSLEPCEPDMDAV